MNPALFSFIETCAPYLVFWSLAFTVITSIYGTVLLVAWLGGVFYVRNKGFLRQRPKDPSLLRNMVYFPKLRQ